MPSQHSENEHIDSYSGSPVHPGGIIRAWLNANTERNVEMLALETEISEAELQSLIREDIPLTRHTAEKLSKVFGTTANTMFRMQYEYDYHKENGKFPLPENLPHLE